MEVDLIVELIPRSKVYQRVITFDLGNVDIYYVMAAANIYSYM